MALWKEQVAPRKDVATIATEPGIRQDDLSAHEQPVA